MKRSSLFYIGGAVAMLLCASVAGAVDYSLDFKGDTETINDAVYVEFTDAMQSSVSAGTGVIDPFLTIQNNGFEKGYNSDYFAVMDATRPKWNHSLQVSDMLAGPAPYASYFEFLLDINEPGAETHNSALLTQQALQVIIAPNSVGGSFSGSLADLLVAGGEVIYDLGANTITYDYNLWSGSGQNIDMGVYIPQSLFAGFASDSFVYLYAEFGRTGGKGYGSADGFEEYVRREGGTPVPEPGTVLLLGSGLVGVAVLRKKLRG